MTNPLENPYPGVNAHLMSFLQTPKLHRGLPMWHMFRSQFMVFLTEHLNQQLPDYYLAFPDVTMQVPTDVPDQPPYRA